MPWCIGIVEPSPHEDDQFMCLKYKHHTNNMITLLLRSFALQSSTFPRELSPRVNGCVGLCLAFGVAGNLGSFPSSSRLFFDVETTAHLPLESQ